MTKPKELTDFAAFDKTMRGLLAVPYKELQQKLEEEKRIKMQRKKRAKTSTASRVSSGRKS